MISGYSQTFQSPFNVGDISGNLSAGSITMKPQGSTTVSVTVIPTGGLTGDVSLSCTGPPYSPVL
jgi:hypothetical protein